MTKQKSSGITTQPETTPASTSAASLGSSLPILDLRVERKHFTFELKTNPRGQFLRITEEVNGRYDAIIVPLTGLEQFRDTLDAVIKLARAKLPKD